MRKIGCPEIERRKKKRFQIFKKHKLSITVQENMNTVQYLDVEFDLRKNQYQPYRKPNNEPLYKYEIESPLTVLEQIPKDIGKRLSEISSCEKVVNETPSSYEEALASSRFTAKLVFTTYSEAQTHKQKEDDVKEKLSGIIHRILQMSKLI